MGSKNISVRDDVYRALRDAKGEDESFSEVIERVRDASDRFREGVDERFREP